MVLEIGIFKDKYSIAEKNIKDKCGIGYTEYLG